MKAKFLLIALLITGKTMFSTGQDPDFSGLKIMINPGHGGNDSDDRGMPNGFWESESNLTKGLWLRDLLESRGCDVIISRELNRTEDDLPLSQIAAIANDNNVDLFIAIHSNAGNQTSNYPLTIFNGKSETPSIPDAKVWAQILWEQLITNLATYWSNASPHYIGDLTLNPSWEYGYGVLYPLVVPGIISEGSFHDYRPEMDRLLNLDYRRQEAWNILYAMEKYFNLPGTESVGNISGIIRDSLLVKDNYSIENSPDRYMNVNGTVVRLLETGDTYYVDSVNTGFYMFDSLTPGNYHLLFSARDYFTDTVELQVNPHQFTYHNHWMRADKTMPPRIISYDPGDGDTINCFDPVRITFNMNMDSASFANAFQITPVISGSFTWDKYYLNVWFQPDIPYDTGSIYTIFIDSTAEHQWGVKMDTSVSFGFTTGKRNRFLLDSSFPSDLQNDVSPYLQFRLNFDAPISNSSLINAVQIISDDGSIIGTKAATILDEEGKGEYHFSPSEDLKFGSDYTLQLKGSIRDVNNIPLVDTIEIIFSTMEDPGDLILLNEFDDVKEWIIDFTSSTGMDASSILYKWTKTKRSGEASLFFRYNYLIPDAFCVIKPKTTIGLDDECREIGMWIWGEMSQNEVKLGFDNDLEADLCTINFAGWNYCTLEIPEGADTLTYIRIERAPGGAEKGDIYFDLLSQPDPGNTSLDKSGLDVCIYPNPVTGSEIWVSGLKNEKAFYRILSIHGQLLQKGVMEPDRNIINLNEMVRNQPVVILNITNNIKSISVLLTVKGN